MECNGEGPRSFTDIFAFSFITSFCLLYYRIENIDKVSDGRFSLESFQFSPDMDKVKDEICFSVFNVQEQVANGLNCTIKSCAVDNSDFTNLLITSANNLRLLKSEFQDAAVSVILKSILVFKRYDSRIKHCLRILCMHVEKSSLTFELIEGKAALKLCLSLAGINRKLDTVHNSSKKKWNKKDIAKIGGASIIGGIIVGVTGGLAAPAIGLGIGTVSASLGVATPALVSLAAAQSTGLIAGAVFAASGATIHGYKMSKRLSDKVEEFFFAENKSNKKRLSLFISIHGWVSCAEDLPKLFTLTDKHVSKEYDTVNIIWERKINAKIGTYFKDLAFDQTLSLAFGEAIKHTALSALFSAFALPTYALKVAQLIDNPWIMSINKAKAVGKELALILAKPDENIFGKRPISFYSYSTGCVAVYECLLELASEDDNKYFGIFENIIFVGAPIVLNTDRLNKIIPLVAGRIVNCYSSKDWILSLIYRSTSNFSNLLGLSPVPQTSDAFQQVINIDLNMHGVKLHSEYENNETHDRIKNLVFSKLKTELQL